MDYLALFLCLVLIGWLLARDRRRRHSVSRALWVPVLLVVTYASRSPADWVSPGVVAPGYSLANDVSGSPVNQVFYASVIIAAFLIASSRGVKWDRLLAANGTITIFYAYFFLSLLWSAYPWDSFKRIAMDFGTTIPVIAVILSEKNPIEAVRAVYVRSACILFPLSILFTTYTFGRFGPTYSLDGIATYTGVTDQKNSLGQMAAFLTLFLIWDCLETRSEGRVRIGWDRLALVSIGTWLLWVSESMTSLVCFAVGLTLLLAHERLNSRAFSRSVLIVALAMPVLVVGTRSFRSGMAPALEKMGRNPTLTGRSDIWKHITLDTVDPLVGDGFWCFWGGSGGQAIKEAMGTRIPNAHDGYLDIYLDGGIIGLVLLFCLLFANGNRLVANLRRGRFQRVRFALLVVAILANISESFFARPSLVWFTTILVLIELPSLSRGEQVEPEAEGRWVKDLVDLPAEANPGRLVDIKMCPEDESDVPFDH